MFTFPTNIQAYTEIGTSIKTNHSKNRHSLFALLNNHLIDYPTPLTLTYAWGLGSLAGIFLGLQIITGLVLTMHYAPQASLAFDILEHIMRDVNNGWLWRYLHANGASFFFALIYIHIGRGLYYFSYVRNPGTWLSGMVIFALMMATAFMGYVLPWGQMSFWGATVITNLFSAIPLIGQDIAFWLWGGFSVDNPTLNRFYTLHFVLPFAILGVAGLHMILLHRPGSTNPLAIFDNSNDKIPFFPYFYWKDLTGFLIVIFFYAMFVFFTPDSLGHPDNYIEGNPMVTPTHIVPEWYFLPFYAILRSIPDKLGGVVLMAASIIILFIVAIFYPLIISYNKRGIELSFFSLRENLFFHFFIWFFFFTVTLLAWIGSQPVTPAIVFLGQINTVIYFAWLIYFPIIALLHPKDAFELFLILSITKKIIFVIGSLFLWMSETNIQKIETKQNSSIFTIFFGLSFFITWPLSVEFFYSLCFLSAIYFVVYHAPSPIKAKHKNELFFFTALSILPLCILLKIPNNWIHFYLLFETSALSTTILIASRRFNPYAISASLMYYFTSIIVSIFLLLGIFFFYCEFGTFTIFESTPIAEITNKTLIVTKLTNTKYTLHQLGAVLILFSLIIKIGLTPFHGWAIGVNTGAPLHISAYLQTIYKTLLILLFITYAWKFKTTALLTNPQFDTFFLLIGFFTLLTCSITALIQTGFKQFWAYLSNSTIGFLFILLGVQQYLLCTIYLFFYFLTSFLFFSIILIITKNETIQTHFLYINDFKFLKKINIYFVGLCIIILLTLAGLPPTVLFFIKFVSYFTIFKTTTLSTLLLITILHLITAFLYLKILKIMLFDIYSNKLDVAKITFNGSNLDKIVVITTTILFCFFSINWDIVYEICIKIF